MPAEERKNALTEMVIAVAESFAYRPLIGIGNPYQALRNLPASWLESMDELQNRKKEAEKAENHGAVYQYHVEELRRITAVLENGNEKEAEKRLAGFAGQLGQEPMSMLMRQNIMADFLGEMRKLYEIYQLEISRKNISFLISARTAQDFERAAENMIREFCEGYEAAVSREREEESDRICDISTRIFPNIDISIESVGGKAAYQHGRGTPGVLKHTGKLYRDYLIYLRIEYAKVLLCQEDISVADLCGKVGYGNVSYFIKLFREITGVTPAKYRKQRKERPERRRSGTVTGMKNQERKQARRYDTPYRCRELTAGVYSGYAGDRQKRIEETFAHEKEFYPEKSRYHIYFGDIHGHSSLSDGSPDIDAYYKDIRDREKLDFCALTDHDHGGVGRSELSGRNGS